MNAARLGWAAPELVILAAVTAMLIVAGVSASPDLPASYLAMVIPFLVVLAWWRPAWAFAGLLGIVLVSEQYGEILAGNIQPFLLQALPLFTNLRDFTPFSFVYANIVELWLLLLALMWFLRSVQHGGLRLNPIVCPLAWSLAAVTVVLTFLLGVL